MNNAVEKFKELSKHMQLAIRNAAAATAAVVPPLEKPADSGADSLPDDKEEMVVETELPSTEPMLEELNFGAAWNAALQNQAPPTTIEELKTLQGEIALLESALELCEKMPCIDEIQNDDEQLEENQENQPQDHQLQQQQATTSGPLPSMSISLSGKAPAPSRKQARKLSELASQQHNNGITHDVHQEKEQQQQPEVIPCTEETKGSKYHIPATEEDGSTGVEATTATTSDRRTHPQAPLIKRPRLEQQKQQEQPLGVVPDSQPSNGPVLRVGSSGGALNTQSGAELLNSLVHCGFVAASQLPLENNSNGEEPPAEVAAPQKEVAVEEPAQPFGLEYPAPGPRSGSQTVGASPFFSAGPANNYLTNHNNNINKTAAAAHSRSAATSSQAGKSNNSSKGNANGKTDIRALLLSQKAAQEAANNAAPSQAPMCLAFATSDQKLKEKVEALQRKLPNLGFMNSVTEATTHVIVATDDMLIADKRSRIYLEGLARGCWVLSTGWLDACLDTGIRVKESIYEVQGCHVLPSRFYKDDWLVNNVLGGPERCRKLAKEGKKLFPELPSIRVERFDEKGKGAAKLRDIVLCLLRFSGAKVTENGACSEETIVVTNDKDVAAGFLSKGYKRTVDARWVLDCVSCCQVLPDSQYLFQLETQ
jgi:hypothetical protein